jgi:hypothetical protein
MAGSMKLKGQLDLSTSCQWMLISGRHITSDSLSCYKFHGTSRDISYPLLLQHDIVLTTYGTVVAGYTRKSSLLFEILWYRVVLDEGISTYLIHRRPFALTLLISLCSSYYTQFFNQTVRCYHLAPVSLPMVLDRNSYSKLP